VGEWKSIQSDLRYDWQQDTHFIELQETEMMKTRIEMLTSIDEFTGTYFSQEWVRKNILRQTDEEIQDIKKQIANEKDNEDPNDPDNGIPVNPEAKPGLDAPQAPPVPHDFVPPEMGQPEAKPPGTPAKK
jgi:hypothetical protein